MIVQAVNDPEMGKFPDYFGLRLFHSDGLMKCIVRHGSIDFFLLKTLGEEYPFVFDPLWRNDHIID